MDSTVEIQPEVRSDGVGEKRMADDVVELEGPAPKKAKKGNVIGNMKKVAEAVLVLAALGKMRGGKAPTAAEKEMMAEAREKLAKVCEAFAPKDIFPRDAFGAVIEDLGLNKLKEQRLGFRPPKMSIAEKLLFAKRKMEKTEEFSLPSATYSSQRPQANMATSIDNRGQSQVVRMFPPEKPTHVANPSGIVQPPSPLVHGTPASSAPLPYQLPTSEVRPVIASGAVSSNPVRDSSLVALPRVERPNFRMDGRPNGPSHTLQVQATSGDHSAARTPTWSVQPASVQAARRGLDTKVAGHTAIKVEGGADVKSGMAPHITASRPSVTQTTGGQTQTTHPRLQGTSFVKSGPPSNTHAEIGKIVQKFLQPRLPEHPAWIPPSRDYMNKAVTCQMCKSTINEVDNVLVCDACEKGYHLQCLQTTNQKGVPRGEWHCARCLSITNGKPLPPKYGRVMRNMNPSKMSTIATAVQSSPDTKASGQNENQQKVISNGKTPLKNSPPVTMANNDRNLPSDVKMENDKEMGGNTTVPGKEITENKDSTRSCSNNPTLSSSDRFLSPSEDSSVDKSCEQKVVVLNPQAPLKSETVSQSLDPSQAFNHLQANDHAGVAYTSEMSSNHYHETQPSSDATESSVRASVGNSSSDESKKERVGQINPAETAVVTNGVIACGGSSSDHFHNVDWIGNVLKVEDDKHYYQSCRINGFIYNVQDYVLIRFENERLIPSKLLDMWEDKKLGTKWVNVNRCYLARELPQSVGRPCLENNNEVYLSNYSSAVMAGLIQGPCEVHPPRKFTEESDRRARLAKGSNDASRPLYVCKWIYDKSKGLFRDVSC